MKIVVATEMANFEICSQTEIEYTCVLYHIVILLLQQV